MQVRFCIYRLGCVALPDTAVDLILHPVLPDFASLMSFVSLHTRKKKKGSSLNLLFGRTSADTQNRFPEFPMRSRVSPLSLSLSLSLDVSLSVFPSHNQMCEHEFICASISQCDIILCHQLWVATDGNECR